jgi:hypothetical protein
MSTFMARIELHGANYQDYAKLHACMIQEGFTNLILGDDGATYQLPPAEYNLSANCTLDQARERARSAAQATFKKFAVLVSQYNSAGWVGLTKIQNQLAARY